MNYANLEHIALHLAEHRAHTEPPRVDRRRRLPTILFNLVMQLFRA